MEHRRSHRDFCLLATVGISLALFDGLIVQKSEGSLPSPNRSFFVGYWEGIDEEDGFISNLSITYNMNQTTGASANDRNKGPFKILSASKGIFLFCNETPGVSRGTAKLRNGILVSEDSVVICLDDPQEKNLLPVTLIPNRRNDALIFTFPPGTRGPIVFHRVSQS